MLNQDTLREYASLLKIAHHIPGRIRLKVDGNLGLDIPEAIQDAKLFRRAIAATPGIKDVDLNPLAKSCTVKYDPKTITPSLWEDLVSGRDTDQMRMFIQSIVWSKI